MKPILISVRNEIGAEEHSLETCPAPGLEDGEHLARLVWTNGSFICEYQNGWVGEEQIWVKAIDPNLIEKALRADGYLEDTPIGKERLEMFDRVYGPPEFEPDINLKAIDVEKDKEPKKELKPYFAQVSSEFETEVYAENIYEAFKLVLEQYKEKHGRSEFDGYDISCRVWCSYSDQN